MTQLDLFAEPAPGIMVRWDRIDDSPKPYDELVRRSFPGFEYILYDMRIGQHWYRVLITTANNGEAREPHLCVGKYAEPLPECNPVEMTDVACWDFDISTPPAQVAREIIAGKVPDWTREYGVTKKERNK